MKAFILSAVHLHGTSKTGNLYDFCRVSFAVYNPIEGVFDTADTSCTQEVVEQVRNSYKESPDVTHPLEFDIQCEEVLERGGIAVRVTRVSLSKQSSTPDAYKASSKG